MLWGGEREREKHSVRRNVCQTAIKYHNGSYDKEFLADITNSHITHISFSAYIGYNNDTWVRGGIL